MPPAEAGTFIGAVSPKVRLAPGPAGDLGVPIRGQAKPAPDHRYGISSVLISSLGSPDLLLAHDVEAELFEGRVRIVSG